jgi:hypothetical protein
MSKKAPSQQAASDDEPAGSPEVAPGVPAHLADVVGWLTSEPEAAVEMAGALDGSTLTHLGAALRDEQRRRAVAAGDHDAVISEAFDVGFGRDGLGALPWVSGGYVVCPGAIVAKNRSSHRCRFVSVDDVWIWDSPHLVTETKRSSPGTVGGFRAVALLPLLEGMALDVVTGRLRSGQHGVDRVVSYEVREGALQEVAQRVVSAAGMT